MARLSFVAVTSAVAFVSLKDDSIKLLVCEPETSSVEDLDGFSVGRTMLGLPSCTC